jgi:hypothetical protein
MSETYDCQETGYPRPERRKSVRGKRVEAVEELFNGFHNMIESAKANDDGYNAGYLGAMMLSFARLASAPSAYEVLKKIANIDIAGCPVDEALERGIAAVGHAQAFISKVEGATP